MNKSLILQSKLDNINQVEKIIDEISEINSIHSDLYGKILIATIEGVNNAMVHGNKLDSTKRVFVDFIVVDNRLTISIEDEGFGFDYNSIPDPTMPENIENISGRGVFLMKKLTDDILYNDKGTKVELIFNI
ncbi:MAG: ATP-binding protein [Bacteroidales bacterium]